MAGWLFEGEGVICVYWFSGGFLLIEHQTLIVNGIGGEILMMRRAIVWKLDTAFRMVVRFVIIPRLQILRQLLPSSDLTDC